MKKQWNKLLVVRVESNPVGSPGEYYSLHEENQPGPGVKIKYGVRGDQKSLWIFNTPSCSMTL